MMSLKPVYNLLINEMIKNKDNPEVKEIIGKTLSYSTGITSYLNRTSTKDTNTGVKLVYIYNFLNTQISRYDQKKGSCIEVVDQEALAHGPEFMAHKTIRFDDTDLEGKILDQISTNLIDLRNKL